MPTILDTIADYSRARVAADKEQVPLEELKERCSQLQERPGDKFMAALEKPQMSFICEIKKASPSKGVISEDFPYLDIARDYEVGGADAISCLTEPKWFLGSDEIFSSVNNAVATPMLRKDFTVDEYQIYQAKLMGASAVLLICSLLNSAKIAKYIELADSLGLAALVETHDGREIKSAAAAGAKIIGVNNRNLKDFSVDFNTSARLRDIIPFDCVYVAESGVSSLEDISELANIGADAVLVGEYLMRSDDRVATLAAMREAAAL